MNADEHATRDSLQQLHGLCDRFEKAWQDGSAPDVSQFLESVGDLWTTWQPENRQQLLEELIKLDLEYRWQLQDQGQRTADMAEQDTIAGNAGGAKRLLLEDYARQHPELGSSDRLSLELVLEEYRVRQRWGDQPLHQEYLRRFPDHGPQLQEKLAQVDSDLSAEENTHYRQITSSNTIPSPALASGRFGDYELLEEIARGGMGVVYKARQVSLNRIVALKMILSGQLASEEDVRRFRSEAEAAANLQHPGIVRIYEVGTIDGQHYFSMDFIEGHSLADQAVLGPMEVAEAARLVNQVATAIEYAHQQGILHRDLKPHNVLMDAKNQPWVTDFGLAKRIEGQSDLTGTGQVLGTPSYMPPEQASADAEAMGPASDVYSLGAILYELVTGRPPFKSQTPLDTLLQVLGEEPVSPHSLNGSVPPDLETIILKCLDKDPRRRYQSAQELAEELGRYLAGEPIQARPIGQWERAWRWCRRKPALAGLYGTVAVLLLMLGIGGPMVAFQQASLRSKADRATEEARKNLKTAEMERKRADHEATAARVSADDALEQKEKAEAAKIVAQRQGYNSDMLLVQRDWQETNLAHMQDLLVRHQGNKLKGFEWGYWNRKLRYGSNTLKGHSGMVLIVAFSPDGRRIVSGGEDKTIKIWDAVTGREMRTLKGHTGNVRSVAFSPDGKRIVSGSEDKTIKIWDAQTGQEMLAIKGHSDDVNSVAFSPDGKRVVSGSDDTTVKIWDVQTGQETFTIKGPSDSVVYCSVRGVAFSPDGKRIVSAIRGSTIKIWDAQTGQETLALKDHSRAIVCVAFSPDGKRVVSVSSGVDESTIKIWDAVTGQELLTLKGHTSYVNSVAFSPDGKRIASGSNDKTIKIWDAQTGQEMRTLKGHFGDVNSVAFSPDGKRIVSGSNDTLISDDSAIKIWDAVTGQETLTLKGHSGLVGSVAFSPDGNRVVSGSDDKTIKISDAQTGQEMLALKGHSGDVNSVAFSPDGKRVVSGSADKTVKLWDAQTGEEMLAFKGHTGNVRSVAFSPDGKWVVSGSDDKTVKLWDAVTGQETLALRGHTISVRSVAFSPNGKRIASVNSGGAIKIWDAETGKEAFALKGHSFSVRGFAFSPDGKRIAGAGWDSTIKIWDAVTGREMLTLKGHSDWCTSVAFSPDGRRIVSGGEDSTIKIWDAVTGREMLTLKGHFGNVNSVAFSPDGKRVVSGSGDGTIKIWDGRPVAAPAGTR